jgi:ABC-2 type transport system permease protein
MREVNAVLAIATRDLLKFLRDPPRLVATFVFPLIIIFALGGSLQATLGNDVGFDFLAFVFTGMLAQTMFQSAAMGVISLIDDREHDFSQEIFVAPISRYSIVLGKVLGETLVALPQGLGILAFALVVGVPLTVGRVLGLIPVSIVVCLFGAAFGLVVMSNLSSQRAAQQVFPFIMLPQFFLAGVFTPLTGLPPLLEILSRISPMRYAVDLTRSAFYIGSVDQPRVVADGMFLNLLIIAVLFGLFLVTGTFFFVRGEHNR